MKYDLTKDLGSQATREVVAELLGWKPINRQLDRTEKHWARWLDIKGNLYEDEEGYYKKLPDFLHLAEWGMPLWMVLLELCKQAYLEPKLWHELLQIVNRAGIIEVYYIKPWQLPNIAIAQAIQAVREAK